MAHRELPPELLHEIHDRAAGWGKIVARRAFGDDGPGLDTDFEAREQLARAAAAGLTEGALATLLEQQAQALGEQVPCPDCGTPCALSREPRTLPRTQFADFEPIVDFPHVLCSVYAAAWAVRGTAAERGEQYVAWLRACWQGHVQDVLTELQTWQGRVGLPPPGEDLPRTDPRRAVAEALSYLSHKKNGTSPILGRKRGENGENGENGTSPILETGHRATWSCVSPVTTAHTWPRTRSRSPPPRRRRRPTGGRSRGRTRTCTAGESGLEHRRFRE